MHQGDQYSICVTINKDGSPLAPADCEGVRVRIGSVEQRYPDGDLTYEDGVWLFPFTQSQTLGMAGAQRAQVQVNFGGNPEQIIGSAVTVVTVDGSVIRKVWADD